MTIKRLAHGPIIYPELDASIDTNINGPSLIRVPDWLPDRLGTYYLYFGHHQGEIYSSGVCRPFRRAMDDL